MEVLATTVRLRDGKEVLLRSPRADDAGAALAYMRKLSRQSYEKLGNPPAVYDAMTEDDEATFIETQLYHPKSFLVCAFSGGAIVGSAGLRGAPTQINEHTGELGIGVLEEARRIGLGRALLERVVAFGAANGITNVHLRVRTFNEPAIRLYEALGFKRIGTLIGVARLADGDHDEHVYQRIASLQAD
jgi:RimJ/RimL family protein N-acetyltransferase